MNIRKHILPPVLALALALNITVIHASAEEPAGSCGPGCGHETLGAAKTADPNGEQNGYTVTLSVPGKEAGRNEYLVMFDASESITDIHPENWTATKALVRDIGEEVLAKTDTTNTIELMSFSISAGTLATLENKQDLNRLDLDKGRFRYGISATNCEAAVNHMIRFIEENEEDTRLASVIWITDGGANRSEYPAPLQNWVENPQWTAYCDAAATARNFIAGQFIPAVLAGRGSDPATEAYFPLNDLIAGALTPEKANSGLASAEAAKAAVQADIDAAQALLAEYGVTGENADAHLAALEDDLAALDEVIAELEERIAVLGEDDAIAAAQAELDAALEQQAVLEAEVNALETAVAAVANGEEDLSAADEVIAQWNAILARFDGEGNYIWGDTTDEQAELLRTVVTDEDIQNFAYAASAEVIHGTEKRTGIEGEYPRWLLWTDMLWAEIFRMAGWPFNDTKEVSWGDFQTACLEFDEYYYGSDPFTRSTFVSAEYQLYCVMGCPAHVTDCSPRTADALAELCKLANVTVVRFGNDSRANWMTKDGWYAHLGLTPAEEDIRPYNYIHVTEYSDIPDELESILKLADTTSFKDSYITDYMSKWVRFEEGSVRIFDDRNGKPIYDAAKGGWLLPEADRPVDGKPYEVVEVDAAEYAAGGANVVGNTNGKIHKLVWKIKDGPLRISDLYRLEYDVVVDIPEEGFQWNTDYPANGTTEITYTDSDGSHHTDPIDVPDVLAAAFTVTVNYRDAATGEAIAESYVSEPEEEGAAYDVTEKDQIAIDGYTYAKTEGDPLTGVLDCDKVIDVYYDQAETPDTGDPGDDDGGNADHDGPGDDDGRDDTRDDDDDDDSKPVTPAPSGGGEGGSDTTVDPPEAPPASQPEPETPSEETEVLPAPDVPLAQVPQTGDASLLWLGASVLSGVELASLAAQKKRRK